MKKNGQDLNKKTNALWNDAVGDVMIKAVRSVPIAITDEG